MNKHECARQISMLKDLLLQPSTDVCWSSYNSSHEAINDLDLLEKRILNNDRTAADKLLFLTAPTNDLQEISISSGWGREFLDISKAIEAALGRK